MEFIKNKTIKDLLATIHRPPQRLIAANETSTVSEVLRLLHKHNVHSVPIVSEAGTVRGFVDVRDIVASLISLLSHQRPMRDWSEWQALFNARESAEVAMRFQSEHVVKIMDKSQTDKMQVFSPDTPLQQLLQEMGGLRLHRVMLQNQSKSVLSMSDVINYLAQQSAQWPRPLLDATKARDLCSAQLKSGEQPCLMHENEIAVYGFQLMVLNRVSAVGVVDASGALIANFAASDVRGMMSATSSLLPESLSLPVHQFLLKQTQTNALRAPVAVSLDATLESVVKKMGLFRVHRVWVVDANQKPLAVITPSDILKLFYE